MVSSYAVEGYCGVSLVNRHSLHFAGFLDTGLPPSFSVAAQARNYHIHFPRGVEAGKERDRLSPQEHFAQVVSVTYTYIYPFS